MYLDPWKIKQENVQGVITNINNRHWVALMTQGEEIWKLDSVTNPIATRLTEKEYLQFINTNQSSYYVESLETGKETYEVSANAERPEENDPKRANTKETSQKNTTGTPEPNGKISTATKPNTAANQGMVDPSRPATHTSQHVEEGSGHDEPQPNKRKKQGTQPKKAKKAKAARSRPKKGAKQAAPIERLVPATLQEPRVTERVAPKGELATSEARKGRVGGQPAEAEEQFVESRNVLGLDKQKIWRPGVNIGPGEEGHIVVGM